MEQEVCGVEIPDSGVVKGKIVNLTDIDGKPEGSFVKRNAQMSWT